MEDTGDEPRPWVLRGTPGYMAPELVTDGAATPKCDVFALGVVAHALLTGREPFCLDRKATAREIFACTAQCRVAYDNEDWVGISTAAKLFVAETLERNPKHRPDVGALLDHAWLAAAPARGGAASPGPAPDAAPAPRRSLDRARARLSCLAADRVGARRSSRGGASDAGAGDRDAVETLLEGVDADAAWFDEEIESIRRLFRAVSGDGGEHLSIVDFGRVMAALDMPFTPDVLFPIYDRTRAGTVSAEDFARCVTAVRRAMVSDDAETFPPGSPAYEHAGLAFDAYHRALSPPRLDGAGRPAITPDHVAAALAAHNADLAARRAAAPAPSRGETSPRGGRPRADVDAVVAASLLARAAPEATDGVDRETFIDGAIRRCPLLFGVFFLMNYLLAVVYGSYTAQVKLLKEEALLRQQAALDAAFEQLDWEGQGFLSRARLGLMLDHLPRSLRIVGYGRTPVDLPAFVAKQCVTGPHVVHCHTVHLALGALLAPCTMCGTGSRRSTGW